MQIQDRGIDAAGEQKGVFEPGPEIYAKCVVFAEGPRGSCTKQLIELDQLLGARAARTLGEHHALRVDLGAGLEYALLFARGVDAAVLDLHSVRQSA